MEFEFDYFASGLQMALTVVALSVVLLVDLSRPITLLFLGGIPILLGYTAHISAEEFRRESLASLIGIMFVPLGGLVASASVSLLILNILVTIFASGESFRDYYSSTSLPLLISGLLIGTSLGGMMLYSSDFSSQVEEGFIQHGAERTMTLIEVTGMGADAEENIRNATYANVLLTENFVVSRYIETAEDPNTEELNDAFSEAREEVPDIVLNQSNVNSGEQQRQRIEDTLEKTVSGRIHLIIFVFTVTTLYALQPVLGLLTAFSALMFRGLEKRVSES